MANNSSRKHGWREAVAPGSSARPVEKPWRNPREQTGQGPPWWKTRWARLVFAMSGLFIVAALLIGIAFWWWPAPPMSLVLIGAGYEDNMAVPPNIAGKKSLESLRHWAEERAKERGKEGNIVSVDLSAAPDAVNRALKNSILEKAAKSSFFKKPETMVVFLSAHGVVASEEGGYSPRLVGNDDDLSQRSALNQLDALLDVLAQLPEKTNKLLFVDATEIGSFWPLGQLHNDFLRALEGRRDKINAVPNLLVISSCDKDQRSWDSPEWGQTVFAHFVLEGLKGAADTKRINRVDAAELYRYVRDNVKRWVWHNRARLQTPVLFAPEGRAEKMEKLLDYKSQAEPDAASDGAQKKTSEDGQETWAQQDEQQKKYFDDLKSAWSTCRDLEKITPHPAVYTPQLWRRYLETLLRAERMLRAGDVDRAAKLLERLPHLKKRIEDAGAVKRESLQLTRGMAAALGQRLTPREKEALARLDKLWREDAAKKTYEDDKDHEQARTALLDPPGQDPLRRRMLRATLAGQVVRDMTSEHRLTYGRQLLKVLEADPPYCRPAEVHYLMMVRPEDAAGGRWPIDPSLEKERWPLLQKSLRVRLLAEQAALGLREEDADKDLPAYSEQVLPWIRLTIEQADKSRRRGQDLLFASPKTRWEKTETAWDSAEKLLDESVKGYENAQTMAADIRRALDVRDRLLTELSYYTRWVAEREPEQVESLSRIWQGVHQLHHDLENPPADGATRDRAAKFGNEARRIAKEYANLQDILWRSARKDNPHTQERWHEIEALLSVPFLTADDRLTLLAASRDISRELFANPRKDAGSESIDEKENSRQARALAQRQGRLALAVLGDEWPESAREIKAEIDNVDEITWHRHLTIAGERVGQLLNSLPEGADKWCEEAARTDDLKLAADNLRKAVLAARTVEGAVVETRMKSDPAGEQRRLNLYHLLCWQAERTYLDWWAEFEQTPRKTPYYQRAAGVFLQDAEELLVGKPTGADAPKPSKRLQRVVELRERVNNAPAVRVEMGLTSKGEFKEGTARLDLTDEKDGEERFYRLRGPEKSAVPGVPVMWMEGERGLRITTDEKERKTIEFGPPDSYPAKIVEDRLAELSGQEVVRHTVRGFFRGHSPSLVTEVRVYRAANLTLTLPVRQRGGSVAVQTKQSLYDLLGAKNTAISLVLDCSGSMNYPRPDPGPRRFDKAVQALKGVLQDLPKDVTVSLRTFGAQESDHLLDKGGMKLVWDAHKWDPDKIEARMAEVKRLRPAYTTPLLRSIRMASRDFPRRDFESRTIVVITDGGDSNFNVGNTDQDLKDRSGAATIAEYLKYLKQEFDDSGIELIVIGFDVKAGKLPSKAEERAAKEFRDAMEKMRGTYYDVEDAESLKQLLRRSLLRLHFRVDPDLGAPARGLGTPSGPITRTLEVPHYVLEESGHYLVRVPSSQQLRQPVAVGPGDAVLLELVKTRNGRPVFRKAVYAESGNLVDTHGEGHIIKAPRDNDWLLAVLQNQQLRDGKNLQMLATLEKDEGVAEGRDRIQQVWPEWYWFEAPVGKSGVSADVRVGRVSNYPAPAFGLELPHWPREQPVALRAWWCETLPDPPGTLVKGSPQLQDPFHLVNFNWDNKAAPGAVLLESMKIETHRLKGEEDGRTREVNCLMVRLRYPPDKGPFFVHWPGWDGGQEHRFYREAGKYTGIFWTTSKNIKDEVENNMKRLNLYSVAELKAHKGTLHVKELKVGTPSDVWRRPTPAPSAHHSFD